MSHLYEFSAPGKNLPRRVRDGDPHGRRLRHGGSVALGGSAALVQYSPTRREYFVRNHRPAGARPCCETLHYEDCGSEGCTPQYAGNISRMVHTLAHGNTNYSETRDVVYAYDLMNRLVNVDDSEIDLFDEVFAYDAQGRIVSQRRGANVTATSGGEYAYYAQSNKLEKVSVGMSDSVDAERLMNADSNFVYDADGNMTGDRSKKMSVSYDYRGLPTEFVREVPSATGVAGEADSVRLVMTYDGSGSRIGKRYERRNAGDTAWALKLATHYTGLGSEIRENGDGSAKVVVNLPQGLGRYGVESASESVASSVPSFEYYLKNHLGSTMLVYGVGASNSVKAAYGYRAFGEQVDLAVPTDKVTENFTGKELDDETSLGYWGARYLDQMLGMWVSVDTKRQFASPYLYVGNGANPVNVIDRDGNRADVVIEGTSVDITLPLSFTCGENPCSKGDINKVTTSISKTLTGKFGEYDVNTNVVQGKYKGMEPNEITLDPNNGRAHTNMINGSATIYMGAQNPNYTAAHEAGHLLGMSDKYIDGYGALPGYDDNLMGKYNQSNLKPEQIEEIFNFGENNVEEFDAK